MAAAGGSYLRNGAAGCISVADYGVHGKNGHELDLRLKRECQQRFEELYGHEKFMEVFKKNYLVE